MIVGASLRGAAAFLLLAVLPLPGLASTPEDVLPEVVLKEFLAAHYARDADTAYSLLSEADRAEKTLGEYRAENGEFQGNTLALSRELAGAIAYSGVTVRQEGERATVRFSAALPDANAPELDGIVSGYNQDTLANLSAEALAARVTSIRHMARSGSLPTIVSEGEEWQLIRESEGWRVFVNWAEAIEVTFDSVIVGDLNWEFEPVRRHVLAQYGQTIEMVYRAKNLGRTDSTGKAKHLVWPRKDADFLEIVACFCFLEQTLAPGEEVELPLVFRIDFDAPDDIKAFSVHYQFYPLDEFPEAS